MEVYRSMEEVPYIGNAIVTMGNFDGLHIGHLHVLESLNKYKQLGFKTIVITFWPHPRKVLNPVNENIKFLTTLPEKIDLFKTTGIDGLLVIPFTKAFAQITAEEFVEAILVKKIGIQKVILGYDHRFGKDREGGVELLKVLSSKYNYEFEEIPKKEVDELGISSSQIRSFIEEGKMEGANKLLGRNYALEGQVIEGRKLGRTIGFPTANVKVIDDEKLIPKKGVYAVITKVGDIPYKGMMNIGVRPTVDGTNLSLEVNIFDFEGDLYGRNITIEFVGFLRDEEKFSSIEALKAQLALDKIKALSYLENYG